MHLNLGQYLVEIVRATLTSFAGVENPIFLRFWQVKSKAAPSILFNPRSFEAGCKGPRSPGKESCRIFLFPDFERLMGIPREGTGGERGGPGSDLQAIARGKWLKQIPNRECI